jgi:hypothetical protein
MNVPIYEPCSYCIYLRKKNSRHVCIILTAEDPGVRVSGCTTCLDSNRGNCNAGRVGKTLMPCKRCDGVKKRCQYIQGVSTYRCERCYDASKSCEKGKVSLSHLQALSGSQSFEKAQSGLSGSSTATRSNTAIGHDVSSLKDVSTYDVH